MKVIAFHTLIVSLWNEIISKQFLLWYNFLPSSGSPLIEMPDMKEFDDTIESQPMKNKSQCMFHLWSLIKHIDKDVGRELATILEEKGYLNKN